MKFILQVEFAKAILPLLLFQTKFQNKIATKLSLEKGSNKINILLDLETKN